MIGAVNHPDPHPVHIEVAGIGLAKHDEYDNSNAINIIKRIRIKVIK